MVIRVLDIVESCDTNEQGAAIRIKLLEVLQREGGVKLSFDGVLYATSSFVNTAFVDLLDQVSLNEIKQRLSIVNSNRQINALIRSRLYSVAGF